MQFKQYDWFINIIFYTVYYSLYNSMGMRLWTHCTVCHHCLSLFSSRIAHADIEISLTCFPSMICRQNMQDIIIYSSKV